MAPAISRAGARRSVLEGILARIGIVQPLLIEHVVAATTLGYHAEQLARVGVRRADCVVAACAESPHDLPAQVDALLLLDPFEGAVPPAFGALGI